MHVKIVLLISSSKTFSNDEILWVPYLGGKIKGPMLDVQVEALPTIPGFYSTGMRPKAGPRSTWLEADGVGTKIRGWRLGALIRSGWGRG